MIQDLDILLKTRPFSGFSPEELDCLLPHLAPAERRYRHGATLLAAGAESSHIGVVLEGHIEAAKHTRAGQRFTVQRMGPGGVFGDILFGGHSKSPVTVSAAPDCRVLYFPGAALFRRPPATCEAAFRKLLANLLASLSDKYFALDARLDLLLIHGLRKRLAAYLLDAANGATGPFTIPYDRAGLAAFLGCERSALSREISRMADDGLIESARSRFTILDAEALRDLF